MKLTTKEIELIDALMAPDPEDTRIRIHQSCIKYETSKHDTSAPVARLLFSHYMFSRPEIALSQLDAKQLATIALNYTRAEIARARGGTP